MRAIIFQVYNNIDQVNSFTIQIIEVNLRKYLAIRKIVKVLIITHQEKKLKMYTHLIKLIITLPTIK